MSYLILSIISGTCLFAAFTLFNKFSLNNFQAIVFNYITASLLGFYFNDNSSVSLASLPNQPWFLSAVFLGMFFVVCINLIAECTIKVGITATTVVNKMAVVVPIIAAYFLYRDHFNFYKLVGIFLAFVAVYLTVKKEENSNIDKKYIYLPVILFLLGGGLDTYIKYVQHTMLKPQDMSAFSAVLFVTAGVFGVVALIGRKLYKNSYQLHIKNIVGGILLGVPNFGSIFFLLKALSDGNIESSVVFPINNVGIVGGSALVAAIAFNERLKPINIIGIVCAVVAIVFISFSANGV